MNDVSTTAAVNSKEPATKKAAKKRATAKKAVKKTTAKAEKKSNGLTKTQVKILKAMKGTSSGGKKVTRAQIKTATGLVSGLYKAMGAVTMEGWGTADESKALEPRGLIKSVVVEDSRALAYFLTATGAKMLASL